MRFEKFINDLTALGGLPVFGLVIVIFLLLGITNFFILSLAALALCYLLTIFIRVFYFKARPKKDSYKNYIEKIEASSFPSLHSMRVAALGTILIYYFSQPLLYFVFGLTVLAVGTSRVVLKRHYWMDVLFGLIFGVGIAIALIFAQYL